MAKTMIVDGIGGARETIDDQVYNTLLKTHSMIQEYARRMEGSIDRRGGLRWDELSCVETLLPPFEEQMAIAEALEVSSREIEFVEKQLGQFKEQKHGLIQLLFTGRIWLEAMNM